MERFYHQATQGFCIARILEPSFLGPTSNEKFVPDGFSQTYSFLDCGAQCYAFESENKDYVIKFLKCHHLRLHPFLEKIPLPHFLSLMRNKKIEKKRAELQRHLTSYTIAHTLLQDLTHVSYIHFSHTSHLPKLRLKDKLGNYFLVDLNSTPFMIQKKGALFWPTLKKQLESNNLSEAKSLIKGVVELLAERIHRGIHDKDPDLMTNIGILGDCVFQIDIGRFSSETHTLSSSMIEMELRKILKPLSCFLSKEAPLLTKELELWLSYYSQEFPL